MLLHKHLTPELKSRLERLTTRSGWTLRKAIQSGLDHEDSQVGVYAGDSESYALFSPLLHPIIRDHAGHDLRGHTKDFSLDGLPQDDLDPTGEFILSTRVRVGRNLARYAFPPAIGARDRAALEAEVVQVLSGLRGHLAGEYHPLASLSETRRRELVNRHVLFQQADRFLDSAGVNRDWPRNRGIFHSADMRFIVWVGEEDALRIISMQPGSGLAQTFPHLGSLIQHPGTNIAPVYSTPGVPVVFRPEAMQDIADWLVTHGQRVMFIYGDLDPWTAAAFPLGNAQDSFVFTVPGGNHGSTINQLPTTLRAQAQDIVRRWAGVPSLKHAPVPLPEADTIEFGPHLPPRLRPPTAP